MDKRKIEGCLYKRKRNLLIKKLHLCRECFFCHNEWDINLSK